MISMIHPLTISDFLDRAALVYGDRVGIVDEPGQPAPSFGSLTYRWTAEPARSCAAALDRPGIGRGERVTTVSPNSARRRLALHGVARSGCIPVPVNRP